MKYFELPIEVKKAAVLNSVSGDAVLHGYLLDEGKELKNSHKRPAVIVCPGGCYSYKSEREGEPIAMRFLAKGIQAFVLQYHTAPEKFPCALTELASAVAIVRQNSRQWNIDPERIYICGFSAGGHLCASLGTLHNRSFLKQIMAEELKYADKSWKPNGMILCYPVITSGVYTHEASKKNLIGDTFSPEQEELISLEKQVDSDTVPAFIWTTFEDELVPMENSLFFAAAMRKHAIPFELHIYEKGEHGLALCDDVTEFTSTQISDDNAGWVELAIQWIKRK